MSEPKAYLANIQRAGLLLSQNRPREALPFVQAAIEAEPNSPHGYAILSRCLTVLPGQAAGAISAINRAIALAPDVSLYHGMKAWSLCKLMRYREGMTAAEQGLAIDPNCMQSLNMVANIHTHFHRWSAAEKTCRTILHLDVNNEPALNLLAQALRQQGCWKESRQVVAQLLANVPENAFGQANAGFAALAAGDHLRANEHFLNSLRMDPSSDLARRGLLQSIKQRIWLVRFNRYLHRPGDLRNYTVAALFLGGLYGLGRVGQYLEPLNPHLVNWLGMGLFAAILFYVYLTAVVSLIANFLLLFDPVGRHALTTQEKGSAYIPLIIFGVVVAGLLMEKQLLAAAICIGAFGILLFSIQFPLIRDRWLRRRLERADN